MTVPTTIYLSSSSSSSSSANDSLPTRKMCLKRNKSLTQRITKSLKIFKREKPESWLEELDRIMAMAEGSTSSPNDDSSVSFDDEDSVASMLGLINEHRATFTPKRTKSLR